MTISYLVDTNVLVYAYDIGEEAKLRRARLLLRQLGRSDVGALSTQVLGEFFNVTTRKLPHPLPPQSAATRVARLARSWVVLGTSAATVIEAARGAARYQLQYRDALLWATAKENNVPFILSEDFSDGLALEGVRFRNPFAAEFELEM